MRRAFRASAAATVIAVTILATGCAAAVRRPAQAPEVRLESPTAFRLYPTLGEAEGCTVRAALLQVQAVRGDTIFFRSATPTAWPYAGARCGLDSPGYVLVADHPDLQVARLKSASLWVRLFTLPAAILIGVGALIVILLAGAGLS